MKKVYKIEVDCANCANKMEAEINKTAGVKEATINFMAMRLTVEFEDGANSDAVLSEIIKRCKKIEKDCEIYI